MLVIIAITTTVTIYEYRQHCSNRVQIMKRIRIPEQILSHRPKNCRKQDILLNRSQLYLVRTGRRCDNGGDDGKVNMYTVKLPTVFIPRKKISLKSYRKC